MLEAVQSSVRREAANGHPWGAAPAPVTARIALCLLVGGAGLGGAGCLEDGTALERGSLHIVGGQMNPGDPAVVYLSLGGAACTGSVIAKRWVMTAKHCVTDTNAGWISVYEGANPMGGDGSTLASQGQISRVILYDDGYSIDGVDIALLESSVDLAVTPIPYSRDQNNPSVGDTSHAVGYGQSSDYNGPDGSKRRGTAQVIDNTQNEIWTTAQICFGDSGGPLFDEAGTVIGISSRITNDCSYAEDIFTNVGYFATWIAGYVPDEVVPDPDDGGDDPGDGGGGGDPAPDPLPDPGDEGGGGGGGGGTAPDPGGGGDPGGGDGAGGLGRGFGEECLSGDVCQSSACVTLPSGAGYCTESCADSACPYGFECSSTAQGAFCFLQGEGGSGGGGNGLTPDAPPGLTATCAVAPGSGSGAGAGGLLWALLASLVLARRRLRQ